MDIIPSLESTRNQTLLYFDLSGNDLLKSYAAGKWTIKQLLVHLSDAESNLLNRIKRIISEPRQVIWAWNQDLWCENLDYTNFPLELSRNFYLANRESAIYLAKKYYERLANNEFVHSETGVGTLKDVFDKVVLHNQHHLEQIKKALG